MCERERVGGVRGMCEVWVADESEGQRREEYRDPGRVRLELVESIIHLLSENTFSFFAFFFAA